MLDIWDFPFCLCNYVKVCGVNELIVFLNYVFPESQIKKKRLGNEVARFLVRFWRKAEK